MSYAPGTKLCYSECSQCCTVLTEGNVMVTKGLSSGNLLKLVDWLILADGRQMTEAGYISEKEALAKAKAEEESEVRRKRMEQFMAQQAQLPRKKLALPCSGR